jgi:hypothetical protein
MLKGILKKLTLAFLSLAILSCITAKKDYTKFYSADPHSILIVPAVNKSVNVAAPDVFLSTISIPLAEQGYYVFPVNMIKSLLEEEGLTDADLVHSAPAHRLCSLFGADAVLYIDIEEWDAKYLILSTLVTVKINYVMKDGKTEDTIWEQEETCRYEPSKSSSGNVWADLIVNAATAAITKAAPNYVPLARQANAEALKFPGPGIPQGPYLKKLKE